MAKNIAEQTLVEHKLLSYLIEALRETVKMEVDRNDFSRKLSSLRFLCQSFQRHLDRLITLEECDGYLDFALEQMPHMAKKVQVLLGEHEKLRNGASRIVYRLERVASNDHPAFHAICDDLRFHLNKLEEHNLKEVRLIQEALDRESGGEG